jgi:hypothetical protein
MVGAAGCRSSHRVTRPLPLTVVKAPTPRFHVPRYDTSGAYPQVRRSGIELRAVNTALRNVVLVDQRAYARTARPAAKLAGRDARGVYQIMLDRRLLSASTVVVSALLPAIELYPGGTEGSGWIAGTILVPSGKSVDLNQVFARPRRAVHVLARAWKGQYRRTHRSMVCVTQLPSIFQPTLSNYRLFALTPSGLAVGFWGHASCPGLEATVPYAVVHPYLSKFGKELVGAVRRPTFSP